MYYGVVVVTLVLDLLTITLLNILHFCFVIFIRIHTFFDFGFLLEWVYVGLILGLF